MRLNILKLKINALMLTIAALMAGQTVWATEKTVKYCITGATENANGSHTLTFGLADGSDTPFDGFTTSSVTVNRTTATDQTVTLGDGFSLRLQWAAGSSIIIHDGGYGWNINSTSGAVTYTVACSSGQYFATHLDMQNNEGNQGMMDTDNHIMMSDFDYAHLLSQGYNSTQMFGRLTVTYTDAPPITLLTSPSENTYNITSKRDLAVLAAYVNGGLNTCSNLTFLQTRDITCDASYVPIGGNILGSTKITGFAGTYDGQGHTIRGITVTRTGQTYADKFIGLFGNVSEGIICNVVLANSTFTGYEAVGGIVGKNYSGTVENCRVESTVTINAGDDFADYHGGIVGHNIGNKAKVIGCISAATVSNNGKSNTEEYGGIVGYNLGGATVKDCLYTGTTVTAAQKKGAIVGFDDNNQGNFTNNYYTAINLGGVQDKDRGGAHHAHTVTLGENVALVGDETAYSVSGLTAIGTGNYALRGGSTIYSGKGQTLTLSYSGDVPEGYELAYIVNGTPISGNTFTMPDEDVTVSAVLSVSYIDEDGTEKRCYDCTPITSDVTTYGTGGQDKWYVVNGNVTITGMLIFQGNAHLILMDGATLNVNNNSEGYVEDILGSSLTIYAQSTGTNMGNLVVNNKIYSELTLNGGCINGSISTSGNVTINGGRFTGSDITFVGFSGTLTINGGTVNVDNIGYGREHTCRSMTINGGTVNVSSGISFDLHDDKIGGTLTINGGIVTANRIEAEGEGGDGIILGWTNASDRITVNTYSGSVSVKHGQWFSDGTAIYSGTLSDAQVYAIKGKTLIGVVPDLLLNDDSTEPADGKNTARIAALADGLQHNIVLQGRTLFKDGVWNTLCLPFNLTLSGSILDGDNVDVRTLSSTSFNSATGELTLNFTAEGAVTTLTAGTPYIIKWSKTNEDDPDLSNLVNPVFTSVTISNTTANVSTTYADFKGTYAPINYAEDNRSILLVGVGIDDQYQDVSTLYWPQSGATIGAFRAYFQLNNGLSVGDGNSNVKAFHMNVDENTDGIGEISTYRNDDMSSGRNGSWYDFSGRRLDTRPTRRGFYIHQRQKNAIK